MSISSQLTPIPLAQASAMLRAMAQVAGQNVEARVLAQLANGATQVQIGRQLLSLQLPTPQPVGTVLTLSVQQAEGQVQVALVSARPPAVPNGGSVTAPGPQASQPATSVQLSPAALSGSAASPSSNVSTPQAGPVPVQAPPQMPGPVAPGPQVGAASSQAQAPVAPQAASASQPPQVSASGQANPQATAPPAAQVNGAAAPAAMAARPVIPYAAAAPASVAASQTQMPSVAGSAATALPPVAQSVAAGHVGQHAPSPNAPGSPGAGVSVQPPVQAAVSASPQAALAQMVQQALPRQDSVVNLTMALANVVGRVALPEPVLKAAQQVLGQRLTLDGGRLDGSVMQQAVRGSGVFQEAMLAAGLAKGAGGDMKTALLGLQRQLGAWLGDQAPVEQVHTIPPPLKGMVPRAKLGNLPMPDLPDDPELAGRMLLERTEAALSRLRLHQHVSLPEPGARHEAQWSLDLPVMVAGQQSLLQMQIHRDGGGDDDRPEERGWQVRFAINLSELGEVGAQISLRDKTAGVLLWADRAETATLLNMGAEALRSQLEAVGLVAGAIVVRAGAPAAQAAPSGHVLDALL